MKRTILVIIAFVLMLSGCSKHAPQESVVVPAIEPSNTISMPEKAQSAIKNIIWDDSPASKLQESVKEAQEVHTVLTKLIEDLDEEARVPIEEALNAFAEDILLLSYYAELAEDETLTQEDNAVIVDIASSLDEAMQIFAEISELLL